MKRSENMTWAQAKVGVFIVVALVLFAGGVLLMGEKTKMFTPKGRISLIMTDVMGLKVGAPVWLAGVDVGVVTAIGFEHPERSNDVEIVLEVDKEALKKIGRDSAITMKTRGLMGEKYVDITPSQHVVAVPETRLYGTNMVKLDDVMQKAGVAFDRLNSTIDKMNRGQGSAGKFISDPRLYDNLVQLSSELNSFARSVNRGEGTLGQLHKSRAPYDKLMDTLSRADQMLNDMQKADGTLNKLVYDRQLYDKLVLLAERSAQAAEDVREINKKLNSKETSIGKLLGDREFYDKGVGLIDRADRSVQSLEEIAERVKKGEGAAGRLLKDDQVYDRINKMVENMDLLLKDIKQHPKRYLKFSVF